MPARNQRRRECRPVACRARASAREGENNNDEPARAMVGVTCAACAEIIIVKAGHHVRENEALENSNRGVAF